MIEKFLCPAKKRYLEFALMVLGVFFAGIIVHESTHFVLLGNARGVCFGVCGGVAIATIYPAEPFSMLGTDELIPTITMVIVMFLLIFFVMRDAVRDLARPKDDDKVGVL